MFNNYIWKCYLQSGGNTVVEMFRRNIGEQLTQELVDLVRNLHRVYLPGKKNLDDETAFFWQPGQCLQWRSRRISYY